jgi:outer membrane protein TolC
MNLSRFFQFSAPLTLVAVAELAIGPSSRAAPGRNNDMTWLSKPLSLVDCLNLALSQNSAILKGKRDLEATYGLVVQTRAVAMPKLQATGNYQWTDQIEELTIAPGTAISFQRENQWSAGLRVVQSIYEGGRISATLRTATLSKAQALAQYQSIIADALLQVRVSYYDVLLAARQIDVQKASLVLLGRELEDTAHRFEAGTVPRFNVLRAEVAVANARPLLIRAENTYRIAKNNLANLLGCNLPPDLWQDIPLTLTGSLEPEPYNIELPAALTMALERRPELAALRQAEALRSEAIKAARAAYFPSLQLFAGHAWRNATFQKDLAADIAGWNVGAQVTWNIFDGLQTRGKVQEARALQEKAQLDLEDYVRRVELEVRTAYSALIEAREVLASQERVQEQADEALRLANSRAEAGTGTQLDVLDAQTALTQARTTQIQARHDYLVAKARLERAIGMDLSPAATK